ncbi:MAG: hypothetical protein IK079_03570, partial [Desulfovibrio sp.]|nr:hypothetical protein [Desulfovibrio sp.]
AHKPGLYDTLIDGGTQKRSPSSESHRGRKKGTRNQRTVLREQLLRTLAAILTKIAPPGGGTPKQSPRGEGQEKVETEKNEKSRSEKK